MQFYNEDKYKKVYKSNFHYKHSKLDICLFEIM